MESSPFENLPRMFSSEVDIRHRFDEFTYRGPVITRYLTRGFRLKRTRKERCIYFVWESQGNIAAGNVEFSDDCPSWMKISSVGKPFDCSKPFQYNDSRECCIRLLVLRSNHLLNRFSFFSSVASLLFPRTLIHVRGCPVNFVSGSRLRIHRAKLSFLHGAFYSSSGS